MSTAEFKINASAFSNHGFDATPGLALTLQLEALPGLDVEHTRFYQVAKSNGAPDLVFAPATGIPVTPLGTVTTTAPVSMASYIIGCQINHGIDKSSETVADWTKERIVAVRMAGLRKVPPSEATQYDATYGWTEALNGAIAALATVGTEWHEAVKVASSAAMPACTRTGNVLLADAVGAMPTIDGQAPAVGWRVLLWKEGGGASHVNNGIWVIDSLGGATQWQMTRAMDLDDTADLEDGVQVSVELGTLYADTTFKLLTDETATINVTALAWEPTTRHDLDQLDVLSVRYRNAADTGWNDALTDSGDTITLGGTGTATIYCKLGGTAQISVDALHAEINNYLALGVVAHTATSGVLRIAYATEACARNQADGADISLIGTMSVGGPTHDVVYVGDSTHSTLVQILGGTGVELHVGGWRQAWAHAWGLDVQNCLGVYGTTATHAATGTIQGPEQMSIKALNKAGAADITLIEAVQSATSDDYVRIGGANATGIELYQTPVRIGASGWSTTGTVALAHGAAIQARNNAGALDVSLVSFGVVGADNLRIGDGQTDRTWVDTGQYGALRFGTLARLWWSSDHCACVTSLHVGDWSVSSPTESYQLWHGIASSPAWHCEYVQSAGKHASNGDAQAHRPVARAQTSGAVAGWVATYLDGSGASKRMTCREKTRWHFSCDVACRRSDAASHGGDWTIEASCYRDSGGALTINATTVTCWHKSSATYDVRLVSSGASNAAQVEVYHAAGETLNWTVRVTATEAMGAT